MAPGSNDENPICDGGDKNDINALTLCTTMDMEIDGSLLWDDTGYYQGIYEEDISPTNGQGEEMPGQWW